MFEDNFQLILSLGAVVALLVAIAAVAALLVVRAGRAATLEVGSLERTRPRR
ncbi:hypothetical protein PX52LOC_07597 [Limnoglobus roseus]|uniref:Uncharacterized protein n=1 Tax=Limnoglobus roseus TaxID=2598579 RepID=A0A5C1API3_9BACT|nr:hypothetical protein PX52LOC_07597 [Limnoglobus roseus]